MLLGEGRGLPLALGRILGVLGLFGGGGSRDPTHSPSSLPAQHNPGIKGV